MDFSKLSDQLVKEAQKNPVKAGALGLLTLVALWFWAPLVWGWIHPADSTGTETPAETTPDTAVIPATTPTPAATNFAQLDWQGLLRARRIDPQMSVATWNSAHRDPFREIAPPKPVVEKPQEAIVATPTESTLPTKKLSDVNLTLQGVMLGTKTRSATINGITLLEGSTFAVDQDGRISKRMPGVAQAGDVPTFAVELREVHSSEVTLVGDGKEWKVPLKRRGTRGGTIEITRISEK